MRLMFFQRRFMLAFTRCMKTLLLQDPVSPAGEIKTIWSWDALLLTYFPFTLTLGMQPLLASHSWWPRFLISVALVLSAVRSITQLLSFPFQNWQKSSVGKVALMPFFIPWALFPRSRWYFFSRSWLYIYIFMIFFAYRWRKNFFQLF